MISLTLAPALLLNLTACGTSSPTDEKPGADGAEPADSSAAAVPAEQAMKPYGEPWLTSIADGMITSDLANPDLKDDYYLNINYEWLRDTILQPGYSRTGGIDEVSDIVNRRIGSLCTDESIPGRGADFVREYYRMNLDWASRAKGREFFLAHLQPIRDIVTLTDLTDYLTSEESENYGQNLCGLFPVNHLSHPEDWMINTTGTDLTLRDSAEYTKQTPVGTRIREYKDSKAVYMLRYAGLSEEEIKEVLQQNYDFEKMLAPSLMTIEEISAADALEKGFNIRTREELAAASPNFPFIAILDRYGYNPELDINIESPVWLEKLNEVFTEENVPLIRSYLLQRQALDAMPLMDEDAYREYQRLEGIHYGLTEERDDESIATEAVGDVLSPFMDEMYVEKYCSEKMREDVLGIIREIIADYREMVQEEDWLSEETRKTAVHKLDTMIVNAVCPNSKEDWSDLTFRSRAEGGSLIEADYEIKRFKQEQRRRKTFEKPDPTIWDLPWGTSDASYDPQCNAMNVYAGFLAGDIYREDMTREEMLAGVGTVIAHELSHAFDYDAFFRAFAKLRRCKMTEISMEDRFTINPHPMDHLRVNVVAAQFPEFQETYDIKPGDGMYIAPEDRIAVWGMSGSAS